MLEPELPVIPPVWLWPTRMIVSEAIRVASRSDVCLSYNPRMLDDVTLGLLLSFAFMLMLARTVLRAPMSNDVG